MEATERVLFESGVRRATETSDGAALDRALDDIGWRDALAVDRPTAVSVLFESQGATTTTSAALDWLLGSALGVEADGGVAVVLPSLSSCDAPGTSGRGLARRSKGSGPQPSAVARRRLSWPTRQTAPPLCRRPGPSDASAGAGPRSGVRPVRVIGDFDSVGGAAEGGRLAARGRRTACARARTGRRDGRCSSWHAMHALERTSSVAQSGAFRRSATVWPRAWSPSRRRPPCWTWPGKTPPPFPPPWPRPSPAARRARGPALPAGAGRHRLHHRAPAAPLRPADDRPRSASRLRERPHPHPGGRHPVERHVARRLPPLTNPAGRPPEPLDYADHKF